MLVFIAGWNVSPERQERAPAVLDRVAANYPFVDVMRHDRLMSAGGFVDSVGSPPSMSAPSVSVAAGPDRITLIAGTALDPVGRFNAMQANELASNMEKATELEGQFVIVDCSNERLEIVNDAVGVLPVFFAHRGNEYLVSNSATALALLVGIADVDPLGMSTFLEIRWPMGDRTLIQDVRVLPGGQRWSFRQGRPPRQQTYYDYRRLARLRKEPANGSGVAGLVTEMGSHLKQLGLQTRALQFPLTAGVDTRVMAALSLHQGLTPEYFTVGNSLHEDVQTAKALARQFDLDLRHDYVDPDFICANWSQLADQVVRRNDGLVTLQHIHNVVDTVTYDYLPIMLYGVGGEVARGHGHDLRTCFGQPSVAYLSGHLRTHFAGSTRTLLTEVTRRTTRRHLREFVAGAFQDGFASSDLPELIKVLEKLRRWGGHQSRQVSHQFDVFSPFGTRPYVEAAFRLAPPDRLMQTLPLAMIRHAAPHLLEFSFDKPLPPGSVTELRQHMVRQHRAAAVKDVARSMGMNKVLRYLRPKKPSPAPYDRLSERSSWLEGSRATIASFCLDQTSSQLWDYVSRPDFERLFHTGDAALRRTHQGRIFDVVTAFYYDHYLRSALDDQRSQEATYAPRSSMGQLGKM